MGILVKGEITITKGFKTWKEMVYAQDGKLKEHGIKFIFDIFKDQKANEISSNKIIFINNINVKVIIFFT